jgi:hypothetical protein
VPGGIEDEPDSVISAPARYLTRLGSCSELKGSARVRCPAVVELWKELLGPRGGPHALLAEDPRNK